MTIVSLYNSAGLIFSGKIGRQLARRVGEIMNQLKTDAYVNVEHIPSCSNTDVNDVSRFRNSTDTVS